MDKYKQVTPSSWPGQSHKNIFLNVSIWYSNKHLETRQYKWSPKQLHLSPFIKDLYIREGLKKSDIGLTPPP